MKRPPIEEWKLRALDPYLQRSRTRRAVTNEMIRGLFDWIKELEREGKSGWTMVLNASPNNDDVVLIWDGHDVYVATFNAGVFLEHNAGIDGDVDKNSCVTHWRPLPEPPYRLPSPELMKELRAIAFDYDRMYAKIREQLAESGFEILKDDVTKAVTSIGSRGETLSYDAIIREALGPKKFAEFERRK